MVAGTKVRGSHYLKFTLLNPRTTLADIAAVLTALGVLTVIAAVSRLVTGTWPTQATTVAGAVAGLTLGSTAVVAATAVAIVVGLVLLVAGVKPGGFRSAQLRGPEGEAVEQTDYVITNSAIARLAAAGAAAVHLSAKRPATARPGGPRVPLGTADSDTHFVTAPDLVAEARAAADAAGR